MKVAYIVSRFPALSETFVLREMDALARDPGVEVGLMSLFEAKNEAVHPAAEPWLPRLRRPSARRAALDTLWWAIRRPARLASSFAIIAAENSRRPRVLIRALATLPIASSHARAVEEGEVDHVHAHFATYPAQAAWLCMRLTGVTYSFTAHAHDIFVHQLMLARKTLDARFAVAISEYNRRFLRGVAGDEARVEVVHCGIEPSLYEFRPRETGKSRPVGLCVAGLRETKGHAVLLRALAGPGLEQLRLEFAGDGPLRPELEALAAELGVTERVEFLGNRTEPEVHELLRGADFFVLPSIITGTGDMEGVPVALMEAMASGLPTIGTDQSGIPELIQSGATGVLAEPGSVASLREALTSVAGGQPPLDLAAARATIEEQFDVTVSARRLAELFTGPTEPATGRPAP